MIYEVHKTLGPEFCFGVAGSMQGHSLDSPTVETSLRTKVNLAYFTKDVSYATPFGADKTKRAAVPNAKRAYLLVMTLVLTVSTGCVATAATADEAAPNAAPAHSSELPR